MDFKVMKTFEFDSFRKAVTVVARCVNTGRMLAFTKGADSNIKTMLKPTGSDADHDAVVEQVYKDVENFSSQGLRTLVFAFREIQTSEENLNKVMQHGWDELEVEDVEVGLTILGATGVEDML
jgi:magnesium-transporting ATPase (P-type)